jgi:hypothetical protein
MEPNMRRSLICAIGASFLALSPAWAQEERPKAAEPLALSQPESVDGCLSMMEAVIERANTANMLDDQLDKAEAALEIMEEHCIERRFAEALASAHAVMALVNANK